MINDGNEPQWQLKPHHTMSAKWRDWLLHKGSFVERLKHHGIEQPEIIVLKQTWEKPLPEEQAILNINFRCYALVREVLIKSIEGAWMVARAIFPKETITGNERRFLLLKNHSLGSVLFKYPDLQRSAFELACLSQYSTWHKKITQIIPISDEKLWARRSIFTIRKKLILLSEVFLPDVNLLG